MTSYETRTATDGPSRGTPEHDARLLGARTEADLQVEGMTKNGREFFEFVKVVAQQGADRNELIDYTATVYTAGWKLSERVKLAWKILRNR